MDRERQRFLERLAWYLMGIAIGLVLLGMFWVGRQRAGTPAGAPPGLPGAAAPSPSPPDQSRGLAAPAS